MNGMTRNLFFLQIKLNVKDQRGQDSGEYVHTQIIKAYYLQNAISLAIEIYNVPREKIIVARPATYADLQDYQNNIMAFDCKAVMHGWWTCA